MRTASAAVGINIREGSNTVNVIKYQLDQRNYHICGRGLLEEEKPWWLVGGKQP